MEDILLSLQRISFTPSYDGLENPMGRLMKDLTGQVYTSEEAAIERIANSQDQVALLKYHPGRCQKLVHFAASKGYNTLLKFILSQSIESDYSMSEYMNSPDGSMQTPLPPVRERSGVL